MKILVTLIKPEFHTSFFLPRLTPEICKLFLHQHNFIQRVWFIKEEDWLFISFSEEDQCLLVKNLRKLEQR